MQDSIQAQNQVLEVFREIQYAFVAPFLEPAEEHKKETAEETKASKPKGIQAPKPSHNLVLSNDLFFNFKFFEMINQKYMANYIRSSNSTPTNLVTEDKKADDDLLIRKINAVTSN